MAATFTNDIQATLATLVTVCGTFTDPNGGTVTADDDISSDGLLDSQLPYVWCRDGRMLNRNEISSDLFQDTYQFQAIVYVQRLEDGEYSDETAFDNASNWIKTFHKHLAQNRAITQGAHIVVANVRDSGTVSLFTKTSVRYSGVAFTIPINILTRF